MKRHNTPIAIFVLALIVVVSLLLPGAAAAQDGEGERPHSLTHSVVLMRASQSRLYEGGQQLVDSQRVTPDVINEHRDFAQYLDDYAETLPAGHPAKVSFSVRAAEHRAQADQLARRRIQQYRRGKGLQIFVRHTLPRAAGNVVGGVMHGVGKTGEFVMLVAKEVAIEKAREMVRSTLRDLGDVVQGKFDALWVRVAEKVGLPVAVVLREFVVDPAFVRWRDQIAERLGVVEAEGEGASGEAPEDEGIDAGSATIPPTATPTDTPTPTSTPTPEPTERPTEAEPTERPTVTPRPTAINFTGSYHSDEACPEGGEDAPYTWGLTLRQDGMQVFGDLYYHRCPGGGRAYYTVRGTAVEGATTLTLRATKTGGRGDLGDMAVSEFDFTFSPGGEPEAMW